MVYRWLPFIGNSELKKLSKELGGLHLALAVIAKKYNTNVLGLNLGSEFVVTVFSYPVVRRVLTGHEYDGRPDNFFIRLRSMGTRKDTRPFTDLSDIRNANRINGNWIYAMRAGCEDFREVFPHEVIHFDHFSRSVKSFLNCIGKLEASIETGVEVADPELGTIFPGYVNSQNMRLWSAANPHFRLKLHYSHKKIGVWATASRSITGTDGEHWKIQSSFVATHLRNLGFGKKIMELTIKDEISEVLPILEANSHTTQVGMILAPAIINILWAVACGSRFDNNDARLIHLLEILDIRSRAFDMSGGTLNQYPWLRYIAPERTGYNFIKQLNYQLKELFMETITQHYQTWTEGRDDDLVYTYITEMKKANGHNTTFTGTEMKFRNKEHIFRGSMGVPVCDGDDRDVIKMVDGFRRGIGVRGVSKNQ
ncbi:hypothetical protein NQ318_015958, partial [Aromia moschata]